ncbi:universal stress protein [Glycomyces harbinensis]|uniref:Nucleotide-binding universal stress protein, UspA family n=1 Tax=Glycomyces harbinensis TaxID=58114 RepID=A0A1G6XL56_9ACTN|nr:universal stress protein [Glycomyces harbinensis]SDD78751.1 Nucleotide-binding universal stress protein, UspA family [Glycomyces harbinensis]
MSEQTWNAGKVVVGVDGSKPSRRALEWALRYAEATGASVTAVQAWRMPFDSGSGAMVVTATQYAARARRELNTTVDEIAAERPRVRVERHVAEGHPAPALIDQSKDAELLVVGSRGHGGFVGAIIGSVSQYCVHHAPCPVLIIRNAE